MTSAREILLTLSWKYGGDWEAIYRAIQKKEMLSEEIRKEALSKTKSNFLTLVDTLYPYSLQQCFKPPFVLYYYGDIGLLSREYRLTVVGTRTPTDYQKNAVASYVEEAESALSSGVVVVSGMAGGIDQAAMNAAYRKKAPFIGILGGGIDRLYPESARALYEAAKRKEGLVLSEYPLDLAPKPENFLFRNRILAALSDVVLVGGGKNRSGTATTARYALEQGKEILALPCNNTGDDLTNSLIRDGAEIVLSSEDLISSLRSAYRTSGGKAGERSP